MSVIPRLAAPRLDAIASRNGYPRFSDSEMERRHEALRANLRDRGLDVAIAGGATGGLETTVQYFTNWPPLVESFLVVPVDGEPTLFVRLWNHLPDAKLISVVSDVRYGGDTGTEQAKAVASFLQKSGYSAGKIGWLGAIGARSMNVLQKELVHAEWVDLGDAYSTLRLVKSDEEMSFIRLASSFNDVAIEAMRDGIHPGMREYEIPKLIEAPTCIGVGRT